MTRSVLISGGGIAGPSLAYWLGASGYAVTVVERAPGLRSSGAVAVDFRGDQLALLARMGVRGEIEACQTGMGDQAVIDSAGRRLSTFPSALFSGEVEIERGDLARILYENSKDVAEYVFGDHITALAQDPDGVDVTFAHGPGRRFDLVVGADGMHSAVRQLAFAEEDSYRHDLGLTVAGFTVPNTFGLVVDQPAVVEPEGVGHREARDGEPEVVPVGVLLGEREPPPEMSTDLVMAPPVCAPWVGLCAPWVGREQPHTGTVGVFIQLVNPIG